MDEVFDPSCPTPEAQAAWAGVSMAFASLGRMFLCLDREFRVLHASRLSDAVASGNESVSGRPIEEILGADLFGEQGSLRQALLEGERREGWRASLHVQGSEPQLVSVTAAPFPKDPQGICDPRVAYVVVLRPEDQDPSNLGASTAFCGMVARSDSMARIFRLIQTLSQSEATVLLTGESGTGKERVARAIHEYSPRRHGLFVAVNCGALPADLLESELFGHVRGAFTGAVRDRVGRFELAARGTLFLDEVADLPVALQVKLLRALQERTFERVGESSSRTTDARIVAATNLNLRRAVTEGRFREDLYYRLRVVPIHLPPLRERREDIGPLALHLLARVGARHGRAVRLSPDTLRALLRHHWPGNVRELENTLEYAVTVASGQTILPDDLPVEFSTGTPAHIAAAEPEPAAPADEEGRRLRATLDAHGWKRDEAARALGISRTTLWRKMRELRLVR